MKCVFCGETQGAFVETEEGKEVCIACFYRTGRLRIKLRKEARVVERCERCFSEVPLARAEFLRKEGRPLLCLSCQQELEESGEYETYVAELSCVGKEGEGYAFEPVKKRGKETEHVEANLNKMKKEVSRLLDEEEVP